MEYTDEGLEGKERECTEGQALVMLPKQSKGKEKRGNEPTTNRTSM